MNNNSRSNSQLNGYTNTELLGQFIEYHINNNGFTSYNQAAKEIGISSGELLHLRKGTRQKPNPLLLNKIAGYLGLKMDDMMDILLGKINSETMSILEIYQKGKTHDV